MPKNWISEKLGELVISEKGKNPKALYSEKKKGLIPYINIKAFEKGIFDEYTDGKGCNLCGDGDLLIVWDGSRSGLVGRAYKGAIGSTLARIEIPLIEKDFLYYFLQSKYLRINTRAKGTGTPHVDPDLLWNYDFPIVPFSEQKRIVVQIEELFSDLENAIQGLKKSQDQIKIYRKAVLRFAIEGKITADWRKKQGDAKRESGSELLDKIRKERKKKLGNKYKEFEPISIKYLSSVLTSFRTELPEAWAWGRIGEVGFVQLGRQRAPRHHIGPNMRPYLRVANVFDNNIDTSDVLKMNFSPNEYKTYRLKYGDILLNEGQSPEFLGRPAMYKNELPGGCFQNTLIRFQAYKGIVPEYALIVFRAYLHIGRFRKTSQITTNIAHMSAGRFSEIEFPVPPLLEQMEIVSEVDRLFSISQAIEKTVEGSLIKAEALRQSILKQAFEGKLVPQNPNDPPASELLQQIKAEKELRLKKVTEAKAKQRKAKLHKKKSKKAALKKVKLIKQKKTKKNLKKKKR